MTTNDFDWWWPINGLSENFDTTQKEKEDGSEYKINSYGFRSDEFIDNHIGKHILFSGCSHTYGTGLKKEEVWAYNVYNKIKNIHDCSGYFNLGQGGSSISNCIINIFKYCKKFKNPDIIFINLPQHSRFFDFDKTTFQYRMTNHTKFNDMCYIAKLINYNYYLMLEQYCESNGIKLFSFSCDTYIKNTLNKNTDNTLEITNNLFKKYNFKTFYAINENDMLNDLFLLKQKNNNIFFDIARDNQHRGTGQHLYWANFIYNKYLEKISK